MIDSVVYAGTDGFPGAVGSSISLQVLETAANDYAETWCLSTTEYGTASNLGTPGAPNDNCSTADLSYYTDDDGDGVSELSGDCDDADSTLGDSALDGDCDGVLSVDDCDDSDTLSDTVVEDGDCDGVLTADDCDDSDNTDASFVGDCDQDGVATVDDCDDNNLLLL